MDDLSDDRPKDREDIAPDYKVQLELRKTLNYIELKMLIAVHMGTALTYDEYHKEHLTQSAVLRLLSMPDGPLIEVADKGNSLIITDRGRAHLANVLDVKLPVKVWRWGKEGEEE